MEMSQPIANLTYLTLAKTVVLIQISQNTMLMTHNSKIHRKKRVES